MGHIASGVDHIIKFFAEQGVGLIVSVGLFKENYGIVVT